METISQPLYLGEEGTEQFTVESVLDGKTIKVQPIHDPFINTTVGFRMSRWSHFKAIFFPPTTKVVVMVRASEGAQRAIMTLNPEQLERDQLRAVEDRDRRHGVREDPARRDCAAPD